MSRWKLFQLWVLCTLLMPVLSIAMLIQAVLGSESRAKMMAIAQDECGNALFGGPATQTISARTGDDLIEGKGWAQVVGPIIDHFFGKGHCLSNVDLPADQLNDAQKAAVNAACAEQDVAPLYVLSQTGLST